MSDEMDDIIDALLRDGFEGPVPEDGFCASVMERLPAQQLRRNRWPLLAGTFAGVAACGFTLKSASIASVGLQDWLSGQLSSSAIALFVSMSGMAVLAMAWTIAEAGEPSAAPRPTL